jgi:hypothetical protein
VTDKIDQALAVLGLTPSDLDPAVLTALRSAKDQSTTRQAVEAFEAAFEQSRTDAFTTLLEEPNRD